VLEHYLYVGRDGGMLLALGVGSLFNHSQQPNLNYTVDHDQLVIRYRAARAIAAHEELTITYGSSSKLWFEDKSVQSSRVSMMHEDLDDETGFLGGFQLDNGASPDDRV
jgi:tRNA-specific adenosine deaminase 3